jgi:UDP-GlcNAc:undecaprenyl-phosphate GlcNAc-1-phosphate transferase
LIFIIGILDDKFSLNHYLKLFLTAIIIYAFIYFDPEIKIAKLIFEYKNLSVNLGKFSIFFTILSIMLFLNAANMFDGINLQSSIFFTFCLTILMFKNINNFYILFLFIPLIFIIYYNYYGKIFLGNSGVLVLSFFLSTLFIKNYNQSDTFVCDEIFLIMLVPGIDMFRLFLERLYNKKNPFKADNNHIHHLLIKNLSITHTNILITSTLILGYLLGLVTHYLFGIIFISLLYFLTLVYLKNKK